MSGNKVEETGLSFTTASEIFRAFRTSTNLSDDLNTGEWIEMTEFTPKKKNLPESTQSEHLLDLLETDDEVDEEFAKLFEIPEEISEQVKREKELFETFPKGFDTFAVRKQSITFEQQTKLYDALAQMLKRADQARKKQEESGKDVDLDEIGKEVFGHIPRNFWPPQFKKELQDWRITRDTMNDLALKEFMEKHSDNPLETAKSGVELFSTVASTTGSITENVAKVFDKEKAEQIKAVFEKIGQLNELLSNTLTIGKNAMEVAEVVDPVTLKMMDQEVMEGLASLASVGVDIATEFVPVLGTLKKGASLIRNIQETCLRIELRGATGELKNQALANTASQLSKAFEQAESREKLLGVKSGVDSVQDTIGLGASIAKDSVVGVKVAGVLKVTEGVISVGSTVVFQGIDWSQAATAVKTLNEARAGNETAQKDVFAHHSHYAKMLIAIKAREKDPLAIRYFVDRGLTEKEIAHPRVAAEILFKFGLRDSKETDSPKTWRQTLDEKLEAAANALEKVKNGVLWIAKKLGLGGTSESPPTTPTTTVPFALVYSLPEIRQMERALQTYVKAKEEFEEDGEKVPTAVDCNIKNLQKTLSETKQQVQKQLRELISEREKWTMMRARIQGDEIRRRSGDKLLNMLPSEAYLVPIISGYEEQAGEAVDTAGDLLVALDRW